MLIKEVSYLDIVGNFAHVLNELAPKVEQALTAGSLTQAHQYLNEIDSHMEAVKHHYHCCMAVRDRLAKEGYGKIHLLMK